ncbi:lens intrinsic membrane protein 2.3 isoform X2 [Syngnathoides biaculeatus]|uniref:lens intrinsic membrane protein 2.3 isoform X2 n=1 Tax=Syngnathoides biaculeatus TaxID=300417 RepID=UPI002ADE5A7F|nr:lens intrinsic membrane protein 2.3 isoform X2 [Syngnathoides biaculeatus]
MSRVHASPAGALRRCQCDTDSLRQQKRTHTHAPLLVARPNVRLRFLSENKTFPTLASTLGRPRLHSDGTEESDRRSGSPLGSMYSFMGGGLFCAGVGNILLIVSTATDYWMQYRHSSNYMHQGLWRYCVPGKCMTHTDSIAYWDATRAFMILSLLACFIGIVIGVMAFIHYSSFDGFDKTFAAGILFFISCFFVLLAMAVYTGVTVNYYGKRYGSWRFSWSYIMGWVAVVLTFFSGIFYMCAYRMHECPRNSNSR